MKAANVALGSLIGVVLALGVAEAQETGGSFGGGDWGGGGGSYSSGSGGGYGSGHSTSYDHSSDWRSSWDTGDSHSGGSSSRSDDTLPIVLVILGLVGVSALHAIHKGASSVPDDEPMPEPVMPARIVDVTVLRIALDARVRPFVQKELARIATTSDTKTRIGLASSLREVALMLRKLRASWVYGGAENFPMGRALENRIRFQQQATAARALFQKEMVRAADGKVTTSGGAERRWRSDEGPGLILVTLVVAANQQLLTINVIEEGENLRRALEMLAGLSAHTLVAVETVWTPADPDDRMSSVELEALLPGKMFPIKGAMVGRVICSYCSGPFPGELMSCPHCGAPARDAREARTA